MGPEKDFDSNTGYKNCENVVKVVKVFCCFISISILLEIVRGIRNSSLELH